MLPFVTLARSLPTAVLMCLIAVFLVPVMPLVPIVVAFFIIFPMLYQGINTAINNVNKKQIEMLNAFNVSK
jgi:ABC-type nitrate/sulfonate/bicarbonate transport system permease component